MGLKLALLTILKLGKKEKMLNEDTKYLSVHLTYCCAYEFLDRWIDQATASHKMYDLPEWEY